MIVILNPSPIDERILTLDYSMIDYLILNEIEAKDITGALDYESALSIFQEKHPHMKIMLTLGKRGCIYQDENQRVYHPVFETNAIDTTAAGDTFTGYFVRGISQGIRIEETLKMASCAAAISVSRKGASTSIPLFQEVQENLKILKTKENNTCSEQFLRQLDEYINSNISTATLEGLAKVSGYSKVYTSGLIKKDTSLDYKQYLHKNDLRRRLIFF